jgi:hypothetical protein
MRTEAICNIWGFEVHPDRNARHFVVAEVEGCEIREEVKRRRDSWVRDLNLIAAER